MANQKILFPYNFTVNDEKALDYVIRTFSGQGDAEVTIFNAYKGVPDFDVRTSPVMEKMSGNLSYLRQKISEQENGIKAAMDKLVRSGFSSDRVNYVFKPYKKDVAQEIIETASGGGFNTVVLNRSPMNVSRFFSGSVSKKVSTGLKNVNVMVVA